MQLSLSDLVSTSHFFTVPLNHNQPSNDTIEIHVREVTSCDNQNNNLPYLVFFQGGPGFAAPRPIANDGWLKRATKEFRVLLLDQRGTGLSTPVNHVSLIKMSAQQQANYLSHFRADSIVKDAEYIRKKLIGQQTWSVLGQSFGGFCVVKYLNDAPDGLKEAYITGGLPSLTHTADAVYQKTFARVKQKNRDFFTRFPNAQQILNDLAHYISNNQVILPNGETLTVEMLQCTGIHLGLEQGPETLYYLFEQALINSPTGTYLNPLFLTHFCTLLDYNTNPLFALLHEPIYNQNCASNWSAQRIRNEFSEFNYKPGDDLLLTGEMIFPWYFEQFSQLKPLQKCAELLAQKCDWPALYNSEKLSNNRVPVAAAIYSEDMFVEMEYSLQSANQIANLTYWLTSEYEHNGIRMDGEHIFDRLIALNRSLVLR